MIDNTRFVVLLAALPSFVVLDRTGRTIRSADSFDGVLPTLRQ
jgi:hypothetical protein